MRTALLTLAIVPMCLGSALACDDHVGTCEIEDWRWQIAMGMLSIEASTTCDSGLANIRLYDESGDEPRFLGIAQGIVEGHALTAFATDITRPESLSIKYSIDSVF